MRISNRQKWLLVAPFSVILVGVCGLVPWLLLRSSASPRIEVADLELSELAQTDQDQTHSWDSIPVDERLRLTLRSAKSAEDKQKALNGLLSDPHAKSDLPTLRNTMWTEKEASVRVRAFDVAKQLADNEGRNAVTSVLADAIDNPYSDVRREGLRACAKSPRYELFEGLMKLANGSTQERFLAVQALAFLDEPAAQEKVLEMAKSEDIPRPERMRAIALLSQTSLAEPVEYLKELVQSDDKELRAIATEALSIIQQRRSSASKN